MTYSSAIFGIQSWRYAVGKQSNEFVNLPECEDLSDSVRVAKSTHCRIRRVKLPLLSQGMILRRIWLNLILIDKWGMKYRKISLKESPNQQLRKKRLPGICWCLPINKMTYLRLYRFEQLSRYIWSQESKHISRLLLTSDIHHFY